MLLALTAGIKNNKASSPNSRTIVKALPTMNFQNSINFSLKPFASEWKTQSLFVMYATNTARIIAIAFATLRSIEGTNFLSKAKAPQFIIVVSNPKIPYKITSLVQNFLINPLIFSINIIPFMLQ